jgi:micrococcal nuclease
LYRQPVFKILACCLLLVFVPLVFSSAAAAKTLPGKVLKVFDGDTFLVRIQGRDEHVRLREIDAPEISHKGKAGQEPWGRRARDFALSLARNKNVLLEIRENDERDKYNRLLAYVFVDQTLVNLEMIRSGNALFYPGPHQGQHAAELQQAEAAAREGRIGIFDPQKGLKEIPQEFRARTQRDEGFFSRFRRALRGEKKKPSSLREYPVPADQIVANRRSMIYHLPGSRGAARVSPKNRIFFATFEEAEQAGFRRAYTGNANPGKK